MDGSAFAAFFFAAVAYVVGRYLLGRITRTAIEAYALAVLLSFAALGAATLGPGGRPLTLGEIGLIAALTLAVLAAPAAIGVYVSRQHR